jgi:GNAT superfamily N-acetyltransferase
MTISKITPTMVIDFKPAQPDDLPLVIDILAEAAAWLQSKDIDQWPFPIPDHWQKRMAAKIEQGQIYAVGINDNWFGIVGLAWKDAYWPDDGQAGYVHRMALRTAVHGQGIGEMILFWAQQQVKQQGRQFVRLDCAAGDGRLRQYYKDMGFLYKGLIEDHDYSAALYEKDVSVLL